MSLQTEARAAAPQVSVDTEPNPTDERPPFETYPGLLWQNCSSGEPRLLATSETTGLRYLVDVGGRLEKRGPIEVFEILRRDEAPEAARVAWEPRRLVARVDSSKEGVDAAELRDFRFFRQREAESGRSSRFRGSRREVALDRDETELLEEQIGMPAELAERRWAPDGRPFERSASFFEAAKTALKQNRDGSLQIVVTVPRGEAPIWLSDLPLDERLMVGVVHLPSSLPDDRARSAERRELESLLQRASMRPQEPDFQEFLARRYDHWGLIAAALQRDSNETAQATAETLRRVIGVPTRADLKHNKDAQERFSRLDQEYYFHMRGVVERLEQEHEKA